MEIINSAMNFGFDTKQKGFEDKSVIDVNAIISRESYDWINDETLVVVIKVSESNLGKNSSGLEICGKTMLDWVLLSSSGCEQKVIDEPSEEEFLNTIKMIANEKPFVAVFYSDTPLIQKKTFYQIMDFFSKSNTNVLKLLRGYVFRTKYLQLMNSIFSPRQEDFNVEEFTLVNNAQKLNNAFKVLNERILNYHKQNNTVIFGEETVFIDADVEIESGVTIYPNNVLKGQSYIGKNVTLESGNIISDTLVCDNSTIIASYLDKSKVSAGKTIGPFVKAFNENI